MTTPANVLSTRVISARNRLVSSGLYLGDSTIATRLEWVRQDRGHVLSYIPHEISHANVPTAPARSVDAGTAEGDRSAESDLSPPPSAAVLSAIVCIDCDDFWLTSDGGYRGPNTFWREILDVKPSCTVSEPGLKPVNLDFVVVLQMLHMFTEKCVTPGYSRSKSFFSNSNMGPMRFKLRHQLFEACPCI
ncbi:hypothetical protein EDC04DRAFT_2609606 [Pisolithus marmoratus]|nr:hypothetical protein EDC04DRAFT_2609606 [Pisolithus marmoratus]